MKKILVTGGNGYIGSKLATVLKEKGYEVETFDQPKDIRSKTEVEEAVKGKDIVYHLAAVTNHSWMDAHPSETFDVNIVGTKNVAEACAANKVLLNFISTCSIFEDSLESPTDVYAASKAAGEWVVKAWHISTGVEYNILRVDTVYGLSIDNKMRTDTCIPVFLEHAIRNKKLPIFGTGKETRNYLHIDDVIDALVAVLEKEVKNETINLSGVEQISVLDVARTALKSAGMPEDSVEFYPPRKNSFSYPVISIERAKKLLGWYPKISFEQGMSNLYNLLKNTKS